MVDGTLEQVIVAANAPAAGQIEVRLDQTATTVTDASYAGGLRAPRKGELITALENIIQQIVRDTTILE